MLFNYYQKGLRGFWAILVLQGGFFARVILECFVNFLDDPYYEPPPWFMISFQLTLYSNILAMQLLQPILFLCNHISSALICDISLSKRLKNVYYFIIYKY